LINLKRNNNTYMFIIKEAEYNLEKKFKYFNELFFENSLPKTKVGFSKMRKGALGVFSPKSKEILISEDLIKEGELTIDHVLIHEMIHFYTDFFNLNSGNQHHGKAFKAKVDEINKKSNNKYKLTLTHISMTINSEKEEKKLFALIPTYSNSLSIRSVSSTIQLFTEENFNKNYLENLVEKYARFADAKFFWVVETKMNNNYISEEYVESRLNKIKNVFFTVQFDKYFMKMIKQSKDFLVVGRYDFNLREFVKV